MNMTEQSLVRGLRPLALAFLLPLALGACQTAQMRLPETLTSAQRMPVEGRQGWKLNERLRFGPFEAHEVRRSWTRGRDGRVLMASGSQRDQRYSFTLREGGEDQWRAECQAALSVVSIDVGVVEIEPTNRSALDCRLQSLHEPSEYWQLVLTESRERPLSGALRGRESTLGVKGTNRFERGLPTQMTTGYEIAEADRTLAAVEVVNSGAVWLQPDLDPARRKLLSATAAALLLLEDLRETLPES
ncbi:MAG: hypothetical protein H0W11_08200 [Gemmatimonadetes bacterium]|nr:hypothetical protein [Gemmatimonadota bacterium]